MDYEAYLKMVLDAAERRDKYISNNWNKDGKKTSLFVLILKIAVMCGLVVWLVHYGNLVADKPLTLNILSGFLAIIWVGIIVFIGMFGDNFYNTRKHHLIYLFKEENTEDAKIIERDKRYRNLHN